VFTQAVNHVKRVIIKPVYFPDIMKDTSPMMKDTVEKVKRIVGKARNYGR